LPNSLRNQPSSEDQRNVIIATVLVAVIMFVWMFYIGPTPAEQAGIAEDTTQQETSQPAAVDRDTAGDGSDDGATASASQEGGTTRSAGTSSPVATDSITAGAAQGTARRIVVETDLYTAVFSTKGATLQRFTLKEYLQYNQEDPVQIVDTSTAGALALAFTTPTSRLVDTRDLYFAPNTEADTIRVTDENRSITFSAGLGQGSLRQTYTFHPDDYDVGLQVEHVNATSYATRDGYELIWDGGLPFSEGGSDTEQQNTGVFARSGGEVESITVNSEQQGQTTLNGEVSWLSVKNKYFTAALMPDQPGQAQGADLVGSQVNSASGGPAHSSFVGRLRMPVPTAERHTDSYHLYLGPLNYQKLASYDRELYDMVDYGWDFFEWMTRPLATFFFIPMLTWLGDFMPYGVVVILMAVAIKTVVYPLTKSSYRSMAQMRELQPRMEEIREKYDDEPEKQQEEMMKLYRETGVNPLGGCLPMLLQYPVIIALYQFIPQSIQLRQKSFLWAQDLSAPDVILNLPFTIPFYGDYVAGFTLLMGLSMLVTMRLQSTPGSAGGQMKVFMYAMPAVIFFIFNRFASALSLYYLFYNIVTAVQQKWINYQLEKEQDEDDDASSNGRGTKEDAEEAESKSFFQKLMAKAEEAQKRQQQKQQEK
jgi:YidC/Oxa1 family membrane protein insertase